MYLLIDIVPSFDAKIPVFVQLRITHSAFCTELEDAPFWAVVHAG